MYSVLTLLYVLSSNVSPSTEDRKTPYKAFKSGSDDFSAGIIDVNAVTASPLLKVSFNIGHRMTPYTQSPEVQLHQTWH